MKNPFREQIKDWKILIGPAPKYIRHQDEIQDFMGKIEEHYAAKMAASDRFFNRIIIGSLGVSGISFGIAAILHYTNT